MAGQPQQRAMRLRMPRIRRAPETSSTPRFPELVNELASEIKSNRACGQPRIEEQIFAKTNLIKVAVVWDKWESVPDLDRVNTILSAYERAESKTFRDRIGL